MDRPPRFAKRPVVGHAIPFVNLEDGLGQSGDGGEPETVLILGQVILRRRERLGKQNGQEFGVPHGAFPLPNIGVSRPPPLGVALLHRIAKKVRVVKQTKWPGGCAGPFLFHRSRNFRHLPPLKNSSQSQNWTPQRAAKVRSVVMSPTMTTRLLSSRCFSSQWTPMPGMGFRQ